LTVSNYAKGRLLECLSLPQEKVTVIYPGVSDQFRAAEPQACKNVRTKFQLPEQYFLFVGALEPRKNLPRLLKAFAQIFPHHSKIGLALVGAPGRAFRNPRLAVQQPGVIYLGEVKDVDLPPLYTGAVALVIPSLMEGFGLPALESMACGTPVIASKGGALEEIVRNSGLFCDPLNIDEISEAMWRILNDASLRHKLSILSLERVAQFSWQKTADQVFHVLQQVGEEINSKI
jgi:glycosyltransferase involved in cell wall biosynthesis